jgi:hypothetical protein
MAFSHYSPTNREQHTQIMGILPTQGHTMFHRHLREKLNTHIMGTLNSWALSQDDSLSTCPVGCIMQL